MRTVCTVVELRIYNMRVSTDKRKCYLPSSSSVVPSMRSKGPVGTILDGCILVGFALSFRIEKKLLRCYLSLRK